MNDGSGSRRGGPWPRRAGAAAVAGIALLVAACGGGGSAATSASPPTFQSGTAKALAYAECMRSHGISNFPDPTVQDSAQSKAIGFSLPSSIDTHSDQFKAASKTCQKQTGFGHISAAQLQQAMDALLKYAECMRSHGITNFPEPIGNSHQVGFNLTGTGVDPNSPQFKAANKTCQPLMPGGGP